MHILMISGKAGVGKDAMATMLKEMMELDNKKVLITHFADLVKYVCRTYFEWDGNKDEAGRSLLTDVGTDKVRSIYPKFWVKFVYKILTVFEDQWDYVIIPDLRMKNEYEYFIDHPWPDFKITTIRLNRVGLDNGLTETQKAHSSETEMDEYTFDHVLTIEGGLDELMDKTSELYWQVFCGKH